MFSDVTASLEPPLTFNMAQELTFTMLVYALWPGLAVLGRAVPRADLTTFLG
jgi:hypothetical protein